ncbi:hypothetical protein J7F03_02590 [Streptomyces sp. ISL-43]|uniref:hypothetical protein n=1 Tax=Streptomyces sp. ISL-43 TaxID=2819183 RepID=UPI001BE834D5|nr:hypothetical protein [Streptomyces sp. ISL-43]MBT2445992.1 hypothetical protein [Streptomyces sp. ISL-43]
MRNGTRLRTTALAALPAAALLAGCGSVAGAVGAEPKLGPVEVNPPTAALALPMDAYTDTEAESIRMGQVQQRLLSRCMARYGFAYEGPKSSEPAGGRGPEDRHRNLFGAADLAYAAAYGYDPTGGEGSAAKPAAPELSDSAYAVMNGEQRGAPGGRAPDAMNEEEAAAVDSGLTAGGQKVPAGGCGREAYRKLYAPTKDSVDLLFTFGLAAEAHDRSKNDSRVLAVLEKWSACMGRSGYSGIKTPYDVIEELGLQSEQGGPKAVNAAKADVACKHEVNLVGVWGAVEKAHQERLVEEHAETLALYKAQREARFRLAAAVA